MVEPNPCQIEPALVAALYVRHGDELRAFLYGVLRDGHLVSDVLQTTFVKAIEKGHQVREDALKSWLFQVAFREALVLRRRQAIHVRASERLASAGQPTVEPPERVAVRAEILANVRSALAELPAAQQQIVQLRMYEELKFAEIARRLKIPLGTVLARMQAALKRLRETLGD